MKQYRSSSKDCRDCPLKSKCIGKSLFKTIAVTVDKELFEKMHNRLQTPMATRMKKLRSSTVEPVLGTLVNFLGMRRVYTKGVSLVGKCMTMAAIANNLKKLMKWQISKSTYRYKRAAVQLTTSFYPNRHHQTLLSNDLTNILKSEIMTNFRIKNVSAPG